MTPGSYNLFHRTTWTELLSKGEEMTERERCWLEYQRSHASARRMALLATIVLVGVMLGYQAGVRPDAPTIYSATGMP